MGIGGQLRLVLQLEFLIFKKGLERKGKIIEEKSERKKKKKA